MNRKDLKYDIKIDENSNFCNIFFSSSFVLQLALAKSKIEINDEKIRKF